MTAQAVELLPPSYHRYPLPADTGGRIIPHDFVGCGDPDWCQHDPAPAEDDLGYELFPIADIPLAAGPKIFGSERFRLADTGFVDRLQQLGLPEDNAQGLAIVFQNPPEGAPNRRAIGEVLGSHDSAPFIDLSDGFPGTRYPLAVRIRSGLSGEETNFIALHEVAHRLFLLARGGTERKPPYGDVRELTGLKLAKAVLLWLVDKEERACNKFARTNTDLRLVEEVDS